MKSAVTFTLLLLYLLHCYQAEARVIFRNPNISAGSNQTPYSLDFNNDGTPDAYLKFTSYSVPIQGTPPVYICGTTTSVGRDGFTEEMVFTSYNQSGMYTSSGTGLAAGVIIGDNQTYTTATTGLYGYGGPEYASFNNASNCYNGPLHTYTPGGLWHSSPQGYIGFKLQMNGLWYYGYIKIEVQSVFSTDTGVPGKYLVTEMAYEDVPGYQIKTGDRNGFFPPLPAGTYNAIQGKAYIDKNSNCSFDAGDIPLQNTLITATSGLNNFYTVVDDAGNYTLDVASGSLTYQLQASNDSLVIKGLEVTCNPTAVSFTGVGNTVTGKNFGFQVSACPTLHITLSSLSRRRCFRNKTDVIYSNAGGSTANNTVVKIVYPSYVIPISSLPAWDLQKGDTLIYNIGSLTPFNRSSIQIIDSVICGDESIRGLTQCTKAIIHADNICEPATSWDNSDISTSALCSGNQTQVSITNTGTGDMADSAAYRVFLDNVLITQLKYKLAASEQKNLLIDNQGKAVRIEADLTPGHLYKVTDIAVIEGCGDLGSPTLSKGVINNLPVNDTDPALHTDCVIIRDSYDPNDKEVVPAGFGADNRTLANQRMNYKISFQNTGTDTAYTVVVVDTLSDQLDPSTLRVEGASSNYHLEIYRTNKTILKFIFGGIQLVETSANEPASHGYISFSVQQKPDLTVGTQVKNKAYIYFDYNSAIVTNETSNTIFSGYMKRPTIAFANVTKTYGDPDFNLSLSSTGNGASSFASVNGTAATIDNSGAVTILSAGTLRVKGDVAEQGEYVQWSDTITLSIDKALLTVTSTDQSKLQGQPNPTLTYSFNGFVNGENESVLSGAPVLSTTALTTSAVGDYPISITVGTLTATNYSFLFVDGSLAVQTVTAIEDASTRGIKIYPNPSTAGKIIIDTEEEIEMIVIVNSTGQSEQYNSKNIDTSFKGLLDVKIYTKQGIVQKKVVMY